MIRTAVLLLIALLAAVWWTSAAPRPEIEIGESISIDRSTGEAIAKVDRSSEY